MYALPLQVEILLKLKTPKTFWKTKYFIDGKYVVYHEEVKVEKVHGKIFIRTSKSDVQIYDGLDYRHWDTWNEGKYNHVFLKKIRIVHWNWHQEGENFDSQNLLVVTKIIFGHEQQKKYLLRVQEKNTGTDAISTNISLSTI
jgi:hypothetical protein